MLPWTRGGYKTCDRARSGISAFSAEETVRATMQTYVLVLLAVAGIALGQENFKCPDDYGFYPHHKSCDKYWKCDGGAADLKVCGNGLAFDAGDPKYLTENCDYLHNVDCGDRSEIGLAQDRSDFKCPESDGFFPHTKQCDLYWQCTEGEAELKVCGNGLVFDDSDYTRENCDYPYAADCTGREELEPAISTPHCPRLFGIFADEQKCDVFWNCWDGEASRYQCSPGLAYDREARVCMWADQVPECKHEEVANGFACPAPGEIANSGTFSRHAHPEDCRKYYVCLDGVPREYGCPIGTVFKIGDDDGSGSCEDPEDVPGCEDYYGDLDLKAIKKSELLSGLQGNSGHSRNVPPKANPKPRPQAASRTTPSRPSTFQSSKSNDDYEDAN